MLEELQNIIHRDMEKQAYYIQVLLVDELDQCRRKESCQLIIYQDITRSISRNNYISKQRKTKRKYYLRWRSAIIQTIYNIIICHKCHRLTSETSKTFAF